MRKHTYKFQGPVTVQSVTRFSNITGRRNDFRPNHHLSAKTCTEERTLICSHLLHFYSKTTALGSEHFEKELDKI
jgi:hypothetical protein